MIEPLAAADTARDPAYDFDLMLGSGHLRGQWVAAPGEPARTLAALAALADPAAFARKYDLPAGSPVMLFAMGDGNHSLATAKSIWERGKAEFGMDHPARYALVEVENIHDPGLKFEAIHRVLFDVQGDLAAALEAHFGERARLIPCASPAEMAQQVDAQRGPAHLIGVIRADGFAVLEITAPSSNLPVGTLQTFLDDWAQRGGYARIDYVHGEDVDRPPGGARGQPGLLPAGHPERQLLQDGDR